MRDVLAKEPGVTVEYIAVVDPQALAPVKIADENTIAALAVRIGSTRLIDNIVLAQGIA
jgi:pantothenate synthetase